MYIFTGGSSKISLQAGHSYTGSFLLVCLGGVPKVSDLFPYFPQSYSYVVLAYDILRSSPHLIEQPQSFLEYKPMNEKLGHCACVIRPNTCNPWRVNLSNQVLLTFNTGLEGPIAGWASTLHSIVIGHPLILNKTCPFITSSLWLDG